jgi:hypothetical protein
MPYGEPDPQDPMLLVGVEVPGAPGSLEEMAWTIAEEFARMGMDERRILALFRSPFYAGAHRAYRGLGEKGVGEIVRQSAAVWGSARTADRDPEGAAPILGEEGGDEEGL